MEEKILIEQLHKLKSFKPDEQWKRENKEILFKQISNSSREEVDAGWFKAINNTLLLRMVKQLSQPVGAIVLLFFIVFGVSVVSLNAARNTKPGDSLYIAKIVSEKAQLVMTFDKKEKAKLGIKFASNRTMEIAQILAEQQDDGGKEIRVDKLTRNFKKEIYVAKERMSKISMATDYDGVGEDNNELTTEENIMLDEEEKAQMFITNLGKSNEGMEIAEPSSSEISDIDEPIIKEQQASAEDQAGAVATTTGAEGLAGDSHDSDPQKVLAEAEKLFDEQDYDGALDKLEEVKIIIDQIDSADEAGEVKGESAGATTTNEGIEE